MQQLTAQVEKALAAVLDPELGRAVTDLEMITGLTVKSDGKVSATLELTIATCPAAQALYTAVYQAIAAVPGVTGIELTQAVMTATKRQALIAKLRSGRGNQFANNPLTRVLAVSSGKGGVGKSALTVNLAVCLSQLGYRVGVLDADIFGFSIPQLLGLNTNGKITQPTRLNELIIPPQAHGVKAISIGMFLGDKDPSLTAINWRGPMLHRTLEQFLSDVYYGDLDFLVVDLPPGTGDVAISFAQLLPQAEVLVVTTPQVTAADVAVRSGVAAHNSTLRLLGVVENMSYLLQNNTRVAVFGSGGGSLVSERLSTLTGSPVPLLAQIPLIIPLQEACERGVPFTTARKNPEQEVLYQLAERIAGAGKSLAGIQLPLSLL